ncbi:MAG TPA: hypothetical protein VNM67_17095 [Thermoanaerobaculia bacterium]|jgi:hypothetical protein|nr:hypothetical protein [Thermoanaerobaculia bacterium]
MSEPLEAKRPATAVKCEKHGLHYNPATMDGCVICRREAGGSVPARSDGSMGKALAITAVLLLLTTACLYFAHGMVMESFQGAPEVNALDGGLEGAMPEQMREMSLPMEDTGGPVYSGSEGN